MANLSDFNGVKYNSRTAQKNADAQTAIHQQNQTAARPTAGYTEPTPSLTPDQIQRQQTDPLHDLTNTLNAIETPDQIDKRYKNLSAQGATVDWDAVAREKLTAQQKYDQANNALMAEQAKQQEMQKRNALSTAKAATQQSVSSQSTGVNPNVQAQPPAPSTPGAQGLSGNRLQDAAALRKAGRQAGTPLNPEQVQQGLKGGQPGTPTAATPGGGPQEASGADGTQPSPDGTVAGAMPAPTPFEAGMQAGLSNLPPEAQFLAPYLQQFSQQINQSMQENAQMTQGLLGSVEKTYGGLDSQLQEMRQGYLTTSEAMQSLIDDARKSNDEQIAKQEQSAKQQLAWSELKQRRQITKEKADRHDAMVVQIALDGGFAQDAKLREVAESDMQFESRLDDLAVQFGYAQTDLAAKFTGLYNENRNKYTEGTIANMKDLQANLEKVTLQGMSNTVAKQKAEQDLLQGAWKNQTDLRTKLADKNLDVAGQIATVIANKRKEDQANAQNQKNSAYQLFDFAFTNSTDPKLRQKAITAMTAAGYDVTGIDPSAVPVSMQLKAMQEVKGQAVDASTSPTQFAKDPEAQGLMEMANNYANLFSNNVSTQETIRTNVARMLANGNKEQAKNYMFTQAAETLTGADHTNYQNREDQLVQLQGIQAQVEANPTYKGFGFTEAALQGAKAMIGKASPEYTAIAAPLAQLNADIRHQISGAAITPSEGKKLTPFLPSMGDGADVLKTKLDSLQKNLTWINEARVARKLGMPIPPDPSLTPAEQKEQENAPKPQYQPSNDSINNALHPQAAILEHHEIVASLQKAGFSGAALKTAYAIAMAESGGNAHAVGDVHLQNDKWGPSVGLMQVRSLNDFMAYNSPYRDASKLSDPVENAKAAYTISHGGKDWGAWTTYTNGAYKKYLNLFPSVS